MLATAIHLMKGTPYIYQGEEIGMTNAYFEDIEDYKDVESLNYYDILVKEKNPQEVLKVLQEKSRDNARTPMQWNNSINGGFTDGKPWINPCINYKEINAEKALEDTDSIYYFYKKLIGLRKNSEAIKFGTYEILVICNFYGEESENPINIEEYELILGNYKDESEKIRAYEARVYRKR